MRNIHNQLTKFVEKSQREESYEFFHLEKIFVKTFLSEAENFTFQFLLYLRGIWNRELASRCLNKNFCIMFWKFEIP